MTKRERCLAAVRGEEVDRVPFSFWYHFRHLKDDPSGPEFVRCELEFAQKFDVDFLKVMHDIPYELPAGVERLERAADWKMLEPLPPDKGNYGRHFQALRAIREGLPDDRPMVDTFFDPFAYGRRISNNRVLQHLYEDPDAVRQGLRAIAESIVSFGRFCVEQGVLDGMFLAVTGATPDIMREEDFREVFLPLDVWIGEEMAKVGTFNVVHLHGVNIFFEMLLEIPGDVINWSDRTTKPSLAEARKLTDRCLAGGINQVHTDIATPEEIRAEVRDAVAKAGRRKLIVACGCAMPTPTPEENLLAVKQELERL